MKKLVFSIFILVSTVLPMSVSALTIDLYTTNDVTTYRYWGYFGSGNWADPAANPNHVSHSYYPGDGNAANAYLIFDLPSTMPDFSEIVSVYLNLDVTNIWTEGRDDVAGISGSTESVLVSEGTGWQDYDITADFIARATGTIRYDLTYTGYSGLNFGSIEGGNPAYLKIEYAGNDPVGNSVPEPATFFLFGIGLCGLAKLSRKKDF
jgi:hypothetical protein